MNNSEKVHVYAIQNESFIQVSVKDNGIGMDQQTLSNLLKLDKMRSRKGTDGEKGTGLGLWLCKEFIEKHEGKIWVDSKVDKGTIFAFTLPAHVDELVTDATVQNHEKNNSLPQV